MINFKGQATILYAVDGVVTNDVFPSFAVAMRNLRHYPGGIVVPMLITEEMTVAYADYVVEGDDDIVADDEIITITV
jgi:hypothetical protein